MTVYCETPNLLAGDEKTSRGRYFVISRLTSPPPSPFKNSRINTLTTCLVRRGHFYTILASLSGRIARARAIIGPQSKPSDILVTAVPPPQSTKEALPGLNKSAHLPLSPTHTQEKEKEREREDAAPESPSAPLARPGFSSLSPVLAAT